jgi:hypothetical protein
MSFSSITKHNEPTLYESGSISINLQTLIENSKQIFDWVLIPEPVNVGDVYSFVRDVGWVFSNISNDDYSEVGGVVEQFTNVGTSSFAKIVYRGLVDFSSCNITLKTGEPYFLVESASNPANNIGITDVRNVSLNESLISKPVYIAVSTNKAVVLNYRGHANFENSDVSQYILAEPDSVCEQPSIYTPANIPPQMITCIGTQIQSDIFVYPSTLSFSPNITQQTFTIHNFGCETLKINNFQFSGSSSDYFYIVEDTSSFSLENFKNKTFSVRTNYSDFNTSSINYLNIYNTDYSSSIVNIELSSSLLIPL